MVNQFSKFMLDIVHDEGADDAMVDVAQYYACLEQSSYVSGYGCNERCG